MLKPVLSPEWFKQDMEETGAALSHLAISHIGAQSMESHMSSGDMDRGVSVHEEGSG